MIVLYNHKVARSPIIEINLWRSKKLMTEIGLVHRLDNRLRSV